MTTISDYPDVVIHEIAKRLDYTTILAMKLTSRRVHSVLSDPLLFIDLCARDNTVFPSKEFRRSLAEHAARPGNESYVGNLDFERIWAKNPFRANLVPPMLATLDAMRLDIELEQPPDGCEPHPDIERCFATSNDWGIKVVTINLLSEGVPEWMLDHVRPRIIVSKLVAPRWDCSAIYKANPANWEKVEVIFEDYPIGMRQIAVHSSGKDQKWWIGNYGAKFANLQIRIELPDAFRWIEESLVDSD